MEEEVLERLLTKLIGLTEFGALRWHFAGDVSKAYVTVYKNARLKLSGRMIDITQSEGDTVRIDPRLHGHALAELMNSLEKAAHESSKRFRTGRVQAVTPSSLISACKKLLEDEAAVAVQNCLVCARQYDPDRSPGSLSLESADGDKSFYMCDGCVARLGIAVAQEWLSTAARGRAVSAVDEPDPSLEDVIGSDTLSDTHYDPPTNPSENAISARAVEIDSDDK